MSFIGKLLAGIGAVTVFAVLLLFAVCNEDDDNGDEVGISWVADHERERCYDEWDCEGGYDDEDDGYGRGGDGGESRGHQGYGGGGGRGGDMGDGDGNCRSFCNNTFPIVPDPDRDDRGRR